MAFKNPTRKRININVDKDVYSVFEYLAKTNGESVGRTIGDYLAEGVDAVIERIASIQEPKIRLQMDLERLAKMKAAGVTA